LDDIESPEKLRFSLGMEFGDEEWNSVVIAHKAQLSRELLLAYSLTVEERENV
jgi:hypothetical protein